MPEKFTMPQPKGRVTMLVVYYNVDSDSWETGSNDDLIDPQVADVAGNAAIEHLEAHLLEKAQKLLENSDA